MHGWNSICKKKHTDQKNSKNTESCCQQKNNFKQPREYEIMRDSKFAFTDRNNSARIVREIKKMKIFD